MLSVGTLVGALFGASIGDRIGRKMGLIGMNNHKIHDELNLTVSSGMCCVQYRSHTTDNCYCNPTLHCWTNYRWSWSW